MQSNLIASVHILESGDSETWGALRERLILSLVRCSKALGRFGYRVSPYSEQSLGMVSQASVSKIHEIIASTDCLSDWIEPLDPMDPFEAELTTLRRALEKHGFEADSEFWKTLGPGQIVEFYGEDMVQLYRSFNFFAITGYSLLDISIYEWYVLWSRPKQIIETLVDELSNTLKGHIPVKPFATPKHLVREVHNTTNSEAFVPRASWLEPLNLGTLKSNSITQPNKKGFICTSRGEMIALGKEAENIQFI